MINAQKINDMADKISSLLPPGVERLKNDIESKIKEVLQQQLANLDVVTRDEFDIQSKVLARTRAKLDELEKKVAEMETSKS